MWYNSLWKWWRLQDRLKWQQKERMKNNTRSWMKSVIWNANNSLAQSKLMILCDRCLCGNATFVFPSFRLSTAAASPIVWRVWCVPHPLPHSLCVCALYSYFEAKMNERTSDLIVCTRESHMYGLLILLKPQSENVYDYLSVKMSFIWYWRHNTLQFRHISLCRPCHLARQLTTLVSMAIILAAVEKSTVYATKLEMVSLFRSL